MLKASSSPLEGAHGLLQTWTIFSGCQAKKANNASKSEDVRTNLSPSLIPLEIPSWFQRGCGDTDEKWSLYHLYILCIVIIFSHPWTLDFDGCHPTTHELFGFWSARNSNRRFFFRFLAVYAASRCRSVTPQHESAILWCDHIVVSECRGYQWDIIGCEVHNIIAWQNHVGSAWIQKNLKTDWLTILSRAWRHEVNFWSTCQ
jgi:hypothetical protein